MTFAALFGFDIDPLFPVTRWPCQPIFQWFHQIKQDQEWNPLGHVLMLCSVLFQGRIWSLWIPLRPMSRDPPTTHFWIVSLDLWFMMPWWANSGEIGGRLTFTSAAGWHLLAVSHRGCSIKKLWDADQKYGCSHQNWSLMISRITD